MDSNSSSKRWLKIRCEGDKKTVEFLSELFSYFLGTANVSDEELEEASHNGNLNEVSKTQEYILELKGSSLVNAFLFSLLSGVRQHAVSLTGNTILVIDPFPMFYEILKGAKRNFGGKNYGRY